MTILRTDEMSDIYNFSQSSNMLAIFNRKCPENSSAFFKKLIKIQFSITGMVSENNSMEDIKNILKNEIFEEIKQDPFYEEWIVDMSQICKTFCKVQKTESVSFCLGSKRKCSRYHVDYVPLRALVTYAGKGTEWLPEEAADRDAFEKGEVNEKIIKDTSAKQFMDPWSLAIFKGGAKGLLHRTPDIALNGLSILMRLDHPSFLDNVSKNEHMK